MTKKCFYCGDVLTEGDFMIDHATMIAPQTYAHTDCIDSRGDRTIMRDQTQHILGAADSAHQGIELAKSLLQGSLGNMGEILTQGCESLGAESLGSTMRLGQRIKEACFLLGAIHLGAWGLCILLGKDLGVCEDEPKTLGDMVGEPLGIPDPRDLMDMLDSDDLLPGEDEYDDDKQPF